MGSGYFLGMMTASRFRPFLRRRESTSRPSLVRMRFLNPLVRNRLLLCG
jgi:hypothetical protein